jgi:hypothetical protein
MTRYSDATNQANIPEMAEMVYEDGTAVYTLAFTAQATHARIPIGPDRFLGAEEVKIVAGTAQAADTDFYVVGREVQ